MKEIEVSSTAWNHAIDTVEQMAKIIDEVNPVFFTLLDAQRLEKVSHLIYRAVNEL